MIIMALDHTRDYFHNSAFLYSPEDLTQTNVPLFFTRWITHYCAPVFVFLAGISAYLSGRKKSRKELSFFLWTRGVWLIMIELFIISLFRTFNPAYIFNNLQVIWAIGVSMIVLSVIIYTNRQFILFTGNQHQQSSHQSSILKHCHLIHLHDIFSYICLNIAAL